MKTADDYFNAALLLEKSDPKAAIMGFRRAIKANPEHVAAYNSWGNILLSQGDLKGASKKYHKCISLDPNFYFAYYNLGLVYKKSDPKKAIEYFEKTAQLNPDFADAYFAWASILMTLKQNDEAIDKLKLCLEKDPKYIRAYYFLGMLLGKNDPKEGIDYYKKCLEIDSNYLDAYNGWGNLLLDLDKESEAIAKYQKCLEIDPNYFWAHYNLANINKKNDPEKAIKGYQKAIELNKNFPEAYNSLGNLLFDQKKYQEALGQFQKSVQIDPGFYYAYYNQGRCYRLLDPEKAPAQYQKAIKIKPDYVDAYNALGNVLLDMEKSDEAIENYQKCLEIDPDYILAYTNLARVYEKIAPKKSLENYEKAIALDPKSLDAHFGLGNLHLYYDEYDKAREKYLKCIEIDKDNKSAHTNLAITYLQTNPKAAIPIFEKVIDMSPEDYFGYNDLYFCITLLEKNKDYIQRFEDLVQEKATASAFHALGNLYQYHLKDYDEALKNYQKSIELGGSIDLCLDISNVHDSRSNLEKALKALYIKNDKTSNEIYPKHNEAHYLFKMGYYEKSRDLWEEVLASYEKALK